VNDVDDMQRNNMYLIATVRALTEDLEKVSSASAGGGAAASGGPLLLKGPGGGDSDDVAALLAEVSEMRKARQRQEEMVETIVKQRDMYRLAAQTVAAVGDGGGSAMGDNSLALSSPNMSPQQKQQQQQHQLSPGAAGVAAAEERFAAVEHGLRDTVVELERRLARAEEERGIFKQLKEQLAGDERLAAERAATARGEAEREGAQARFLEGQVERLQQDLAGSRREADLLRQRGDKGAATAEAQERSLAEREASVVELTDKWRRAEAKVGSLEQAKAIAEASEQRFKDDNVRLRTEMKQTSGLVDSMQRIESGLSASKAAEAEGLALERDKLREALEQARQDASDAEVRQEQARAAALAEVRQERRKADAANEALAAAKEAASEADQAVAAAKAKAEALQAQLEEVHERSERREATLRGFASVAGGGGAAAGGGDEGESEGRYNLSTTLQHNLESGGEGCVLSCHSHDQKTYPFHHPFACNNLNNQWPLCCLGRPGSLRAQVQADGRGPRGCKGRFRGGGRARKSVPEPRRVQRARRERHGGGGVLAAGRTVAAAGRGDGGAGQAFR
jgi:nucleoprotein TPR